MVAQAFQPVQSPTPEGAWRIAAGQPPGLPLSGPDGPHASEAVAPLEGPLRLWAGRPAYNLICVHRCSSVAESFWRSSMVWKQEHGLESLCHRPGAGEVIFHVHLRFQGAGLAHTGHAPQRTQRPGRGRGDSIVPFWLPAKGKDINAGRDAPPTISSVSIGIHLWPNPVCVHPRSSAVSTRGARRRGSEGCFTGKAGRLGGVLRRGARPRPLEGRGRRGRVGGKARRGALRSGRVPGLRSA